MTDRPFGWEWSTLGEVCVVVGGSTPKTTVERYWGGPIAWVTPDDLSRHSSIGIAGGGRTLTEEGFASTSASMLPPGAVLFSSRAPIGYLAIAEAPLCTNQGFKSVVPPVGIGSRFVYWYLRHATPRIESMASGTTFREISKRRMQEVPIPIPPTAEQDRIVAAIEEHVSRLDAAEAAVNSAAARLDAHERASVASLLSGRNWKWTTLGAIADLKGGVTKDAKRQADPSFVEVPYLRVANVQRGYIDLSQVSRIRVDKAKAESLRLQPGDVLFNEGGDRDKLGRGWVWEGQIEDCIHQNHVFRGRLTTDEFDPYFVSTHANTWGRAWFEEHGRQTTNLASISLSTLKQLPVPVAPVDEQRAIITDLAHAAELRGRLADALRVTRSRSTALRRSILAAAFAGRLVPQDPSDEPASALLERIQAERAAATPTKRTRKAKSA